LGRLIVIKGYDKDKYLEFYKPCTYCVGRGGVNHKVDLKLDPRECLTSRQHFYIEYRPPRFFIRDNNSTNGTIIQRNNENIILQNKESELFYGDTIIAGNAVFRLDSSDKAYSTEAEKTKSKTNMPSKNLEFSSAAVKSETHHIYPPITSDSNIEKPVESFQVISDNRFKKSGETSPFIESLPSHDYYSVTVPKIQLFHNTEVKCILCGNPISVEFTLSELESYGYPVFMCSKCDSEYNAGHNLKGLSDYRILKEVGEGRAGLLYLGRHQVTGMLVAIKAIIPGLSASENDILHFQQEISVIQSMKHSNIVKLYEFYLYNDRHYYIFEYMPEGNLEFFMRIHYKGPMPWQEACRVICDVLSGLCYSHEIGVIHNSIKPANILMKKDITGRYQAKLGDFRLNEIYENIRLANVRKGLDHLYTTVFTAPEQLLNNRHISPQVDIYSTGIILYFLLSGFLPFIERSQYKYEFIQHKDLRTIILENEPVPITEINSSVPILLSKIVDKAISKKPEQRYRTAAEMQLAINDLLKNMN
jgi:hypothetical protein